MSDRTSEPTVLVGVTGCIAAYKACGIVRALQKRGVRVKVVMTAHAASFVGPTTFKALTREPVALELFDEPGDPVHHISLAREADVFLLAPCTANVLNKLAWGVSDDLLTTTALATQAPLLIAPAMNVTMWRAEQTQYSLECLRARGATILEPASGYLACGEEGEGRLAEENTIVEAVIAELHRSRDLEGKVVLVTAGPTQEPLDPVRYFGNRSSGRTGYAIAEEAARRGARVVLVSGPSSLPTPFGVEVVRVMTACEMAEAVAAAPPADLAVFSAAVADFRPEQVAGEKMKKGATGDALELRLVANPDILASYAHDALHRDTYIVGFAAETGDPIPEAQRKRTDKAADLIVANDVSDPALGFGTRENRVWFVSADGVLEVERADKRVIARRLLDEVTPKLS